VKAEKTDTRRITLDLLRAGKSIQAIAAERGLTRITIEGHLAHWVEQGEVAVADLVAPTAVAEISAAFHGRQELHLAPVKEALENRYDYGTIRLVAAHVKRQRSMAGDGESGGDGGTAE